MQNNNLIAKINENLQTSEEEIFENKIKNLNSNFREIIQNGIKNAEKPPKGKRYSQKIKSIALETYFLSPMCYRHIRADLDWPDPRTLSEFVTDWPKSPGLKTSHLNLLKMRANDLDVEQKYVSISCDEMSLKVNLFYDRKYDKIVGLEDYGEGNRTSNVATHVMVFFIQGISGQFWKQPLCYYFVNNNANAIFLKRYLLEVIAALQDIGLIPVHFVCDQGKNFVSLYKLLGISIENPYIEVNSKKIFVMHDTPHLLKSTRNCLINSKNNVHFDGNLVTWKDIEYVYDIDSKLNIRCAPKITDNHIKPHRLQHMKVKLATQVISKSMVSAMNTLYSSGLLDCTKTRTMMNTSNFLLFFNNLFDIHNSSNPKKQFGKELYCGSENQLELLKDASQKVKTIKVFDLNNTNVTNRFSFLNGWLLNNESLIQLFDYLKENGINSISTRRLCQDNIEHFFGQMRRGCGNSESVTPNMFSCLFKKRWGINFVRIVKDGNCEVHDEDEATQTIANSPSCIVEEKISQILDDWEETESSNIYESIPEENISNELNEYTFMEQNAMVYVCGYLYRKSRSLHKCLGPQPTLSLCRDSEYTFTKEKDFDGNNLECPPKEFISYIEQLNEEFSKHFDNCCHIGGVSKFLYERLICVSNYKCCENMSTEKFIYLFIRVRIYFILKFFNRDAAVPNLRKKVLKLSNI